LECYIAEFAFTRDPAHLMISATMCQAALRRSRPRNARCGVVDSRIGMRFSNQREFCSAGQRAAVGSDCSAPRFHAPDWLGIGRTTGRTFLRPDFVTRNLFPFRQVAISGRKLSHPGGDSGAFVMLSTWEQS